MLFGEPKKVLLFYHNRRFKKFSPFQTLIFKSVLSIERKRFTFHKVKGQEMPYISPHHTQFLTVSLCLRWRVSILPTSLPWCWVHCSQKKPCNSWEDLSHQMRTHCGAVWVMRGASQGLLFYKTTSSEISKQRRISHDFFVLFNQI